LTFKQFIAEAKTTGPEAEVLKGLKYREDVHRHLIKNGYKQTSRYSAVPQQGSHTKFNPYETTDFQKDDHNYSVKHHYSSGVVKSVHYWNGNKLNEQVLTESSYTDYGYWIQADGKMLPVDFQSHADVVVDAGMRGYLDAFKHGWVRILNNGDRAYGNPIKGIDDEGNPTSPYLEVQFDWIAPAAMRTLSRYIQNRKGWSAISVNSYDYNRQTKSFQKGQVAAAITYFKQYVKTDDPTQTGPVTQKHGLHHKMDHFMKRIARTPLEPVPDAVRQIQF